VICRICERAITGEGASEREHRLRLRIDELQDQLHSQAKSYERRIEILTAGLAKVRERSANRQDEIRRLQRRVATWKQRYEEFRHDAMLYRTNRRRRKYDRLLAKRGGVAHGVCADCGEPSRGMRCLPCFKATGQFGRRAAA
jgi:DNA repair exonuclease SbcCD ATPase subunit